MLKAGALDRRVTLKRAGEVIGRDEFNAPILTALSFTVSSAFNPVSDAEKYASGEVGASMVARFRIRWSPSFAALSPKWWLEFDGRVFDITGVKEIGRREAIEITAMARAE